MLSTLFSRVLSAPDSPTADLYFRNACRDLLPGQVKQLAPTVFASSTACLVMRHGMRAGRLPERRRLIYLVDDDIDAGTNDDSLPFFYRQKLRMVEGPFGRKIKRFAGVAVVGSPVLAKLFKPLMETHLLRPYWSEQFASLDHFNGLGEPDRWIDMAYLGSVVHKSDLQFILPVAMELLRRHPRLRFFLPQRHRLPTEVENHPRVRRIQGLGWTAYRAEISSRRFHVALYPLLDTPFNRGRSPNKLIEHAVVGAAPVYSTSWREAARASTRGAALCLQNDPSAWLDGLDDLIADHQWMQSLASSAQNLAALLNKPEPQRKLWSDLLGLRTPAIA